VVEEVEALLGPEGVAELDFEALEVALRQRSLGLAARAIEHSRLDRLRGGQEMALLRRNPHWISLSGGQPCV
jgi:hypothetical protein